MINKDELSKKISALIEKIPSIGLLLEFVVVFGDVFKLVAQLEEQVKSAKNDVTFWYNEATKFRDKNIGLDDKLVRAGYELDDAKKTLNGAIQSCNFWAEKARARYDEVVQKEGQLARNMQQLDEANEKIAKQQEVIRVQGEQVGFWHNEALKNGNLAAVSQSLLQEERQKTKAENDLGAYWKEKYGEEKANTASLGSAVSNFSTATDKLRERIAVLNGQIDDLLDRNDRLKAENDALLAKRGGFSNISSKYVYFP